MTPSFLSIYFCGSEHCTPGHAYGPAVRPHYLLHVILQGLGRYQYNGETYELSAGDAFLIPPAEVTYYQADKTNPWSYAWIGFDGQAVPEILSKTVFAKSCIFRNPVSDSLSSLTACMEQLLETFLNSPEETLASRGLLLQLFSFMQAPYCPEVSEKPSQTYFTKAKEYLEHNYAYPIQVSDIARYAGIDRTYLYRIFMEQGHLSPKQYLLRHRLRMAVEMLCTTEYSITEIALSCGFQDASSFSSRFQKQFHVSPRTFRKNTKAAKAT